MMELRSRDHLFPGTFVLKTIRSLDRSFPGLFVPTTDHSLELVPRTIRSFVGTTRKAIGKLNKAIDKLSALVYVHDKFPVQYICYSIDHCLE